MWTKAMLKKMLEDAAHNYKTIRHFLVIEREIKQLLPPEIADTIYGISNDFNSYDLYTKFYIKLQPETLLQYEGTDADFRQNDFFYLKAFSYFKACLGEESWGGNIRMGTDPHHVYILIKTDFLAAHLEDLDNVYDDKKHFLEEFRSMVR